MYPTPDEPWFGCFVKEQVEDLRALGLEVHLFSFDARRDWRNYIRAAARLPRLVAEQDFDVLHAHYGLSGAVALAQRRVPVVTTFHGADTGYIRWQGYISWVVARSTTPVFVSSEGARDLRCWNAFVIPAGVDTRLFAPRDRREARRALGWSEDACYVLFPGARRDLRKRPDLFDAALRQAQVERSDLRAVSLEGFSREEAALVMNAVDVTLMTSDQEGSPMAVRESLACMTPVVSVPVGDVEQQLRQLAGCEIVPRDPALLAQAVLRALGSPRDAELRQRAEESARSRVAEQIANIYARIGPRRA
jgi:glycosyltransferase involved in cell wall biosynthesis